MSCLCLSSQSINFVQQFIKLILIYESDDFFAMIEQSHEQPEFQPISTGVLLRKGVQEHRRKVSENSRENGVGPGKKKRQKPRRKKRGQEPRRNGAKETMRNGGGTLEKRGRNPVEKRVETLKERGWETSRKGSRNPGEK